MSLRRRLLRVLPVALLVALALSIASLDNDDYCGNVGECLGAAFDDAAVVGLSLLLGPLLLWASRLPRVLAHTAATVVALGSLWYAAGELRLAVAPDTGYDAPVPWPLALLVGALAAGVATYAAGPDGRWQVRLAVLAATPLLATGAHLVAEQGRLSAEAERIDALDLTLYAPVIDGEGPDHSYVVDDELALSYYVDAGGRTTFVDVTISAQPLEDAAVAGRIEVDRPGAVLTADFDPTSVDADALRAALEQAPEVGPGELTD